MIKDNKLVEKAMNEYYDLKEEIERKKLDLWKLKEELDSIINQEPYMSGRLKSRQHTIYKLEGQIKALERKMNEIKKNAHLKDSVEILKLSGFPVNDACKVFTKGEAEDGDIILPQHKCCGDDDATEKGSIKEFGKNKEIEKMDLEKDPTLAQDACTEDIGNKNYQIKFGRDPQGNEEAEVKLASGQIKKFRGTEAIKEAYAWIKANTKDSDPKVAEANAIINLCGGVM